jgi:hypothetical protein
MALQREINDILVVRRTASSVMILCCCCCPEVRLVDEFGTKERFVKEFKYNSSRGVLIPTDCAKKERRRMESEEIFLRQSVVKI